MLEEAGRVRVKTVEIFYLLCSSVLLFINTSKIYKVTHDKEKKFMNKLLSILIQSKKQLVYIITTVSCVKRNLNIKQTIFSIQKFNNYTN